MAINPMDVLNYGNPTNLMNMGNPTVAPPIDLRSIMAYGSGSNPLVQQQQTGGVQIPGMGGAAAGAGMGGLGIPGGGGAGGFFGNNGGKLGANLDTAQLALSGLATIANIWGAFEARNLAKKQFNFTRDVTNTNLANQIASYNTTLEDRGRSRAAVEGQSASMAQSYIDKNRLPDRRI